MSKMVELLFYTNWTNLEVWMILIVGISIWLWGCFKLEKYFIHKGE